MTQNHSEVLLPRLQLLIIVNAPVPLEGFRTPSSFFMTRYTLPKSLLFTATSAPLINVLRFFHCIETSPPRFHSHPSLVTYFSNATELQGPVRKRLPGYENAPCCNRQQSESGFASGLLPFKNGIFYLKCFFTHTFLLL